MKEEKHHCPLCGIEVRSPGKCNECKKLEEDLKKTPPKKGK